MAFGVTDSGFNLKRFEDIRASLVARSAGKASLSILDTDAETAFGQIIDILSGEISDMWEMGLAVSQLTNPETVEGIPQDNNAAMVGVERLAAGPSSTYIRYIGDIDAVIPLTATIGVPSTTTQFTPEVNTTLSVSDPISYILITMDSTAADTRSVTIDGNTVSLVTGSVETVEYLATNLASQINGDSSVNSIVTATPVDDTVIITADIGSYNFEFSNLSTGLMSNTKAGKTIFSNATLNGPLAAQVGEVNQIVVAVTGLDSASNTTVAVLGRYTETDEELRIRRRNSLAIIGSGTIDSIVDHVSALDGVTRVTGVENITTSTDGEGRPGKSFEIIVTGGEDQAVADTIWKVKPAGIESYGNVNGGSGVDVKDISGNTQSVEFSRPVERAIAIRIEYQVYAEEDQPTNLQTAMTTALTDYVATLIPGKDVLPQRFELAVFREVAGLQIVEAYLTVSADETSPSAPTGIAGERVPVAIGSREFVTIDVADITFAVIP